MPTFSDESIASLFGAEAAEDESEERFRQYFFFSKTYDNLNSKLPLRILVGHKGVGKSALLKRAYLQDIDDKILSVWITPSEVAAIPVQENISNIVRLIEYWKKGILALIASRVLGSAANEMLNNATIERLANRVSSFVPKLIKTAGANLEDLEYAKEVIANFVKSGVITVYIDDVDRGWSGSKVDIANISALLNAMRDISRGDHRIRFRLGLRTDVYYLVRTSDESTDKIESNVIWLKWSDFDILCIMAKRIETSFGIERDQSAYLEMTPTEISDEILSKVISPTVPTRRANSTRPVHELLMQMTRQRPRDLVKLLHGAARDAAAMDNLLISPTNLFNAFPAYSNERLQDIINEFRSELPDIQKLLFEMRPTVREREIGITYRFTSARMAEKMSRIIQSSSFRFRNGHPINGRSLTFFLFKIGFLTAVKSDEHGSAVRLGYDQSRFIANEHVDFGFDWEIHPAYRAALIPQSIQATIDDLMNRSAPRK